MKLPSHTVATNINTTTSRKPKTIMYANIKECNARFQREWLVAIS